MKLLNRQNADAQLKELEGILDLAGTAGYKVVNAEVISYGSTSSFTQTLTIDAGSSSGVLANMTVLSCFGLVGVVKKSYRSSALVQLAADPAFKIGVRIAGTQQIGILSGQGTRSGVLQLLDNTTRVKKGDVLLARGSQSGRPFVPGVPIGEVTKIDNSPGAITQTSDIRFYADFSALTVVGVVVSGSQTDPRDSLVPTKPLPTPLPTVTIFVTPDAEPTAPPRASN